MDDYVLVSLVSLVIEVVSELLSDLEMPPEEIPAEPIEPIETETEEKEKEK